MRSRFGSLLALATFVWACAPTHRLGGESRPVGEKLKATLGDVQTRIINPKCLSCHTTSNPDNRNIGLANIADLIEGSSSLAPRKIIKPGCPEQSFFFTIMRTGEMPTRGPRVNSEELAAIEEWILGLARPILANCSDEPGD